MNGITRNLLAPNDNDWRTVHRKLGCYGCKFADRTKINNDSCCTHNLGVLVDMNLTCVRRKDDHSRQ